MPVVVYGSAERARGLETWVPNETPGARPDVPGTCGPNEPAGKVRAGHALATTFTGVAAWPEEDEDKAKVLPELAVDGAAKGSAIATTKRQQYSNNKRDNSNNYSFIPAFQRFYNCLLL